MKKSVLAWMLVVLMMVSILAIPAAADESTGTNDSGVTTVEEGGSDGSEGGSGGSEGGSDGSEGGSDGSEGGSGGSEGGSGGSEGGSDGSEGGSGGSDGGSDGSEGGSGGSEGGSGGSEGGDDSDEECKHAWVYVEIDPTCVEYGAKGYGCGYCGEVKDVVAIDKISHSYDNSCDTDCNLCKTTREIEHKFSTQWSKNSTKHWHACSVCGAKNGEGNHYPGPAATEEKAQYCLTCGLMMMPQKNHTHTYSQEYTSDETGHWYACGGCDEKKDFQMHTYDDLCDPDCNDCDYTTQTAHSFNGNWQSDETSHWEVCTLCQEAGESQSHAPGPDATDLAPQLCSVCGYELASAQEHTHEPGENWEVDENSHWKFCACGEKLEVFAHTWDSGNEQEDNSVIYVCMDCGVERTEEAPEESSDGFPWWILLVVLVVIMIGALIALVVVLFSGRKKGKFHR